MLSLSKDGQNGPRKDGEMEMLIGLLHDSMTECVYTEPITSFSVDVQPQNVFEIDILGEGLAALKKANNDLGKRCGLGDVQISVSCFFSIFFLVFFSILLGLALARVKSQR